MNRKQSAAPAPPPPTRVDLRIERDNRAVDYAKVNSHWHYAVNTRGALGPRVGMEMSHVLDEVEVLRARNVELSDRVTELALELSESPDASEVQEAAS